MSRKKLNYFDFLNNASDGYISILKENGKYNNTPTSGNAVTTIIQNNLCFEVNGCLLILESVQRSTKNQIITIQAITCSSILIASTLNLFNIPLIGLCKNLYQSFIKLTIIIWQNYKKVNNKTYRSLTLLQRVSSHLCELAGLDHQLCELFSLLYQLRN